MPREIQLQIAPETASNDVLLKEHVAKLFKIPVQEIRHIVPVKRSIDARQKAIKINLKVNVFLQEEIFSENNFELPYYKNVSNAQEVIVIGAGPAGLFAGLQ